MPSAVHATDSDLFSGITPREAAAYDRAKCAAILKLLRLVRLLYDDASGAVDELVRTLSTAPLFRVVWLALLDPESLGFDFADASAVTAVTTEAAALPATLARLLCDDHAERELLMRRSMAAEALARALRDCYQIGSGDAGMLARLLAVSAATSEQRVAYLADTLTALSTAGWLDRALPLNDISLAEFAAPAAGRHRARRDRSRPGIGADRPQPRRAPAEAQSTWARRQRAVERSGQPAPAERGPRRVGCDAGELWTSCRGHWSTVVATAAPAAAAAGFASARRKGALVLLRRVVDDVSRHVDARHNAAREPGAGTGRRLQRRRPQQPHASAEPETRGVMVALLALCMQTDAATAASTPGMWTSSCARWSIRPCRCRRSCRCWPRYPAGAARGGRRRRARAGTAALDVFIARQFPLRVPPQEGSQRFQLYIVALRALLTSFARSRSTAVLGALMPVICREQIHVREVCAEGGRSTREGQARPNIGSPPPRKDLIQLALAEAARGLDSAQEARDLLDVPYSIVMDTVHPPAVRRAACDRVLLPLLREAPVEHASSFYVAHVRDIVAVCEVRQRGRRQRRAHRPTTTRGLLATQRPIPARRYDEQQEEAEVTAATCCFELAGLAFERLPLASLKSEDGAINAAFAAGPGSPKPKARSPFARSRRSRARRAQRSSAGVRHPC